MESVEVLLGDPKKAIPKLSFPVMVSNLAFTLYNLADGIWVAGLGANSLSAIGVFFPIFMVFLALAFGISIGLSSAVSRGIGAERDVSNIANHGILIGLLVSAGLFSLYFELDYALHLVGARGEVLKLALEYGEVIVFASPVLVFTNILVGILNGEGSTKIAMYANVSGSLINVLLDPIFIYVLGLGIKGAAVASVASMSITLMALLFFFFSGRTFVKIELKNVKLNFSVIADILRVGIPSSFSMLTMSASMAILNVLIVETDLHGLAVFTSAWRVLSFGFIPLFGISAATTAVVGAAYGEKNFKKLSSAYYYSIKFAFLVELVIAVTIILLSGKIALMFTYSEKSKFIYPELVEALRILPIFLPFASLGFVSNSSFQGMGKGERAFVITILRTMVFQLSFAYVFAFPLKLGFLGILIGVTLGNVLASLAAFMWMSYTIRSLLNERQSFKVS